MAKTRRVKPSPREESRRTGRSPWLPGVAAAVTLLVSLAAWRVLPAFGEDQSATAARPIATINAPDVHSLLIDPINPDRILFGAHSGLQESLDGGFTWRSGTLSNADAMSMAVSPKEEETLYVAGHDVFLVSRDGGETWQPVPHDLPGTDLHAFAQDPNDPQRLYTLVVGAGIFTSVDGGSHWTPLPTPPPGLSGHGALATAGAILYAVTPDGLFQSANGGTTWETTATQPAHMMLALAVPANAPDTLYAGTVSGVVKSPDGGASWADLGPTDTAVLALAVAPSDPNRIVIVDETGAVYRSDDGGATWLAPR